MAAPPVRVSMCLRRWPAVCAAVCILGAPAARASRVTADIDGSVAPDAAPSALAAAAAAAAVEDRGPAASPALAARAAAELADALAAASEPALARVREVAWDGHVRQPRSADEELDQLAEALAGASAGHGSLAEQNHSAQPQAHAVLVHDVAAATTDGAHIRVNRSRRIPDAVDEALRSVGSLSRLDGGDDSSCYVDAEGYTLGCVGQCGCSFFSSCFPKFVTWTPKDKPQRRTDVGICSVSTPMSIMISVTMFVVLITVVVALRMTLQWNEEEPAREQLVAQGLMKEPADSDTVPGSRVGTVAAKKGSKGSSDGAAAPEDAQ